MEAFGWPMGPAYLQDVIGMDTSSHVFDGIVAGYPQRMHVDFKDAVHLMAEQRRLGQKSGLGFYRYEINAKGRPVRMHSDEAHSLLTAVQPQGLKMFADEEIIDRLMLPMILEAALCLEERIVETAAEIDASLILGLGFPRYLGGPLKYADMLGADVFLKKTQRHADLGHLYHLSPKLCESLNAGVTFYA
jgi:3-hydroxyacyl-CoA dehydrogenase/enoyl-CoA hydratase/3-hydroxybutyryl-CoA epimerase/enoyl-CoA isomerase